MAAAKICYFKAVFSVKPRLALVENCLNLGGLWKFAQWLLCRVTE